MTSTTDTTQHPDVSEISDLAEGLLSPSRAADLKDHLDGCPLCADVHDSLTEIKGLLGTMPGPPLMPADVAGRIDAALAAEALLQSTAPGNEVSGVPDASASEGPCASTSHVSRETSSESTDPSESVRVTATSTEAVGQPVRTTRPAGHPKASTGPGRKAAERRRRRTAILGAVFGCAALGVGVLFFQTEDSATTDSSADQQARSEVSASAGDGSNEFSDTPLPRRVEALLASEPTTQESPARRDGGSTSNRSIENTPLLQPKAVVPPCIQQGTGRTDAALAAEQGTYQGSRAYLVVLPHLVDGTQVQAYVVDAACVGSAPEAKGKLLLTHSYPRR
ncbi:anti-sigma factor family protein [Streptomyces sp. NRRL F-5135]|uniref:anti-sigma factor family protein n=1 Tax=Streptomyces sp. NRRL F-5135 TaxID=1463858 RepID=UPI0004C49133|nr:zf-HC2 domain-containing protein [Streptomyces sp. NRRL F-5135]